MCDRTQPRSQAGIKWHRRKGELPCDECRNEYNAYMREWHAPRRTARQLSAKYGARHARVLRARGKAADHACTDCGQQAYDWSRIKGTDGMTPDDYQPRCRKCHQLYDGHWRNLVPRPEAPRDSKGKFRKEL